MRFFDTYRQWRGAPKTQGRSVNRSVLTRAAVTVAVLGSTAIGFTLLASSPAAPDTNATTSTTGSTGNTGTGTDATTTTTTTTTAPTTTTTAPSTTSSDTTTTPTTTAPTGGPVQSATPDTPTPVTVDWTGNGAENGTCDTVSDDSIGPVPNGETGWLFVLTSPAPGPWELTTNLTSGVTDGVQQGAGGAIHFIVFSPLGLTLTSASATNGSDNSVLTVSHCQPGTPLIPTTIQTTVFDGTTGVAWSGTETVGATAEDTSTVGTETEQVAGPTATADLPPFTGTVTYTFFTNGTCTAPGTAQTADIVDGVIPPSPTSLSLAAGNYSYEAQYSGDSNYAPSPVGACEPFSVGPVPTTTSTVLDDAATSAPWTGNETAGAQAFDTSTVSGGIVGFAPTGTVTYSYFTNGTCNGTPASTQDVTLNPDGSVPNSSTTAPLAAGSYSFDAIYGGDSNYTASAVSACEPFSVAAVTSPASTAGTVVTPTTPTPTEPTTTPPKTLGSAIAFTGADLEAMSGAAIALLGLGGGLVLLGRRRRGQASAARVSAE